MDHKRVALRLQNASPATRESSKLDSALKKHTALIKRMRQSMAFDNRDQILKDIDTLSLEKYLDEIVGASIDGISRCKSEKDVWSAVEILSALHRRFPTSFTPNLVSALSTSLSVPSRASLSNLTPDQREKEDSARVVRQRPVLRVCSELALVGVISGGEWVMKAVKEMLSNDPSLSSLPLLATFLKSYAYPFLGIVPTNSTKQISTTTESGSLSEAAATDAPPIVGEQDQLIEKDVRDRFKRMCEGYFENVCKKLLIEHTRLQDQDRRNHEAYIRSGEIFEDRQQAYEKMTKGYEKLLANCQQLSELLSLPLPLLPTSNRSKNDVLQIGVSNGLGLGLGINGDGDGDDMYNTRGKWEDEEERKFYEDIQDLKDFVPKSLLGIEEGASGSKDSGKDKEQDKDKEELRKLDEELMKLTTGDGGKNTDEEDDDTPTPTPGTPKASSPSSSPLAPSSLSPNISRNLPLPNPNSNESLDSTSTSTLETTQQPLPSLPPGPSQLLSALLARLPEATNRSLIDQAAIDFAFLNSKAARKRLVKFLGQVPKNRTDLLPYYSRLVATLNPYMPDVGSELVAILDEEFRYLQRKKNVVKELAEVRMKNIIYLTSLTKFRVVPTHLILHIFKVCLDDFSGVNVENIALLLEGCGRFLLRWDGGGNKDNKDKDGKESKEKDSKDGAGAAGKDIGLGLGGIQEQGEGIRERFGKMLELMRRKQSMQHFDQRQLVLLENAYYQCNPPERIPRQEKQRSNMELFIRHLIYDVLAKKTIDKVFKLLRKLDWEEDSDGSGTSPSSNNMNIVSTSTPTSDTTTNPIPTSSTNANDAPNTSSNTTTQTQVTQPTRTTPTYKILLKIFTKPHKLKFSNIPLMAMLTYDLQRYHPGFAIAVVDKVLEDIRRGLEGFDYGGSSGVSGAVGDGINRNGFGGDGYTYGYRMNQKRLATVKYLGELYIYRLIGSGIIFDMLWILVTFGHPDGRPLPHHPSPIDMPDDFFRIRLICVLLDTCGMCFDRGSQKKKLDNFLIFFQYYVNCKDSLPMDIEFMLLDSLEAVRPKFAMLRTIEEAAVAVDGMLAAAFQNMELTGDGDADDSGEDSGEEGDRRGEGGEKDDEEEEEEEEGEEAEVGEEDEAEERAPSPEQPIVLSSSNSHQENLGPSEEAEAEFAKELAKMVTDTSNESRKVDKKTAMALWDSSVLPPTVRKKRADEGDEEDEVDENVMHFTIVTKRGTKHQTRKLAVPTESALAVHTRSAQLQDKVEQQQLKRLVLNYEQREEAEEMKALEARHRAGAIKIRYVG